ncbi:MAG: hypothetical protein PHE55_14105 [Methylococcaceae bacterium]|nr:hypothetical protein [Methylococcaceae bacterium]
MSKPAHTRLSCLILSLAANIAYALTEEEAIRKTQTQACKENQTVVQALDQAIKSHSQRDLGWRTFPGNGYIDVERAVLINKGMEMRYRWRVEAQGGVGPENERAEKLCGDE